MRKLDEHPVIVIGSVILLISGLLTGAHVRISNLEQGIQDSILENKEEIAKIREAIEIQTQIERNQAKEIMQLDKLWMDLDKEQTKRVTDSLEALSAHVMLLSGQVSNLQTTQAVNIGAVRELLGIHKGEHNASILQRPER